MKENSLKKFLKIFDGDDDVKIRDIDCGIKLTVVCLDTMVDDKKVSDYVLQPLAYVKQAESLREIRTKLATGSVVVKIARDRKSVV